MACLYGDLIVVGHRRGQELALSLGDFLEIAPVRDLRTLGHRVPKACQGRTSMTY